MGHRPVQITIASPKGGVGKTMATILLAGEFAAAGHRVGVLDTGPQLFAVEWANKHGIETIGCTGFGGGKLKTLANHNLHVPLDDMGIVESIHLTAFHWIIDDMHRRINNL